MLKFQAPCAALRRRTCALDSLHNTDYARDQIPCELYTYKYICTPYLVRFLEALFVACTPQSRREPADDEESEQHPPASTP